jgi:outer membrane lipoprotein carrier protein
MAASNSVYSLTVSEKLSSLLQPLDSISGTFTQQLFDNDGKLLESSEGGFKLAKPGKILWHVTQPMEQKLVSDGTILWIYDPDLEQVVIESMTGQFKSTPIALLSGDHTNLDERYIITLQTVSMDTQLFSLTPKEQESLFRRIDIKFVGFVPNSISVIDTLDQSTVIELAELVINQIFDEAVFSFITPDQVDVINNVR